MKPPMIRLVAGGLLLLFAVEAIAVAIAPDRRLVLWLSGAVVAVVFLVVRRVMTGAHTDASAEPEPDGTTESLEQWRSRTEATLRWADATRADWDRHLRPRLAREFVMATGHKPGNDPEALHASGQMVFGDDLWPWVDPGNVAYSGKDEPGPGRAALDEILRRMERI